MNELEAALRAENETLKKALRRTRWIATDALEGAGVHLREFALLSIEGTAAEVVGWD